MLAQQADNDPSLWLTVGLPIAVVMLAQVGALLVTLVATSRAKLSDHERFLITERRVAYAAHLRAAERLRDALGAALFAEVRRGDDLKAMRDAVEVAQEAFETASNEAVLLGSEKYVAASHEVIAALGEYYKRQARLWTRVAIIEEDEAVLELQEVDEFTDFAIRHGRDEIEALRKLARSEVKSSS